MSLDLVTMRSMLRQGLGNLDSTDLPNPEADRLLNMALWELDAQFPIKEKECRRTIQLTPGTWIYGLPSDLDAIITVSLFDDNGLNRHLARTSFDTYTEVFKGGHINIDNSADGYTLTAADTEDARGVPTHYFREDKNIYILPVPDDSQTQWVLELLMWKTVASLVADNDQPDLPRNWHEIVVEGAIVRGHFYRQDYNLGRMAENFRVSHVRSATLDIAKEERESRYARVDVAWDEPTL